MRGQYPVSERKACQVIGQHRSTQRRVPIIQTDEAVITKAIVDLAEEYGRYGYRRITGMLWERGYRVNHKRVERM